MVPKALKFVPLFHLLLCLFAFTLASQGIKNSKRSINTLGYPSWNAILGGPWSSHHFLPWSPSSHSQGSFHPFPGSYGDKPSHFSLTGSTESDIAAAVAAAKEATAAAALAKQRVQAAREQVVIQERVAAAKEAAAHAAIQRSEAAAHVAAAIKRSQALAAAAAAVHKSAAASAASAEAAHAAGHFTSAPWTHSKNVFNHWA